MTKLTTEQLEVIRKNAEEASGLPFYAWTTSQAVGEDIPKLLAEVERLKAVISHVNDCAEEFYEYENGVYTIPQNTPNRDFMQEIFVITSEEGDVD